MYAIVTRAVYVTCDPAHLLMEGTFLIGGGGPGLRRGGSLVNILQIGEGQTCFIRNWGRVAVFFSRKKLLHVG